MSEKKTLKRAVKAVWDQVKLLRAERAKLYAPGEIAASADDLAQHADELRVLAGQISALSAMPPLPAARATPVKGKKRTAKQKS